MEKTPPVGFVALVGAGPGDPELITLKAVRHLARADVVLCDALANPALLAHCREDARVLDVGKLADGRHTPQEVTNRLLIEEARAGHYVVRLKGGDPFVFGRGGEEAIALTEARVPHEVVPGISSALAGPAAAHVPVTHRAIAQHVTIVTASSAFDVEGLADKWSLLAEAGGTLVFLMARKKLGLIQDRLLAAGVDPAMPCAMVQSATLPEEKIVHSRLAHIVDDVEAAGLGTPALLVLGQAVGLADSMTPILSTVAAAEAAPEAIHV